MSSESEAGRVPSTDFDDGSGPFPGWRGRTHEIIFEADTAAGKVFDVGLILAILTSVAAVSLESVNWIAEIYGRELRILEWILTATFTAEYLLRLVSIRRPLAYARSFFGVVDLLAVLPSYLSVLLPGAQSLLIIRILRLLRIFRVFKLARFVGESRVLVQALRRSRAKILVFLLAVATVVAIMGALMHLIEGAESGFDNIPRGMYWAIVTMTTVGYGDISPQTVLGQFVASILMVMGYGILAVPTGIFSMEIAHATRAVTTQACPSCSAEGHDTDATHCKYCGDRL